MNIPFTPSLSNIDANDAEKILMYRIRNTNRGLETGGGAQHSGEVQLEPTPIGPRGVEKVVEYVPLTDSVFPSGEALHDIVGPSFNTDARKRILPRSILEPLSKKQKCDITDFQFALMNLSTNGKSSWNAPMLPTRVQGFGSSADNSISEDSCESDENPAAKFRSYQSENWNERFAELVRFRAIHGHCFVPHNLGTLAQWVKRQRYQYKLKQEKKHNTLTDRRQAQLDAMGFIWDSHRAIWEERYRELAEFLQIHGHANVPSNHENKHLAVWVKCQRRQYKLYKDGHKSSMCQERIQKLQHLNFVFKPRRGVGSLSKVPS